MKLASLVVCAAVAWPAVANDKPTTRVYTNADLERVRDKRGQTGVTSEATAEPETATPRKAERAPARGEAYWRQEAARERRRLDPLQDRLLALEQSLREKRSAPAPRSGIRPATDGLETRIETLRLRIREQQARFEDRARREGALPGWLR